MRKIKLKSNSNQSQGLVYLYQDFHSLFPGISFPIHYYFIMLQALSSASAT